MPMAFTKYSSSAAANTAAPPNGAPEGMAPSGLNDTMRDMMAEIRLLGDLARGPVHLLGSVSGVDTIAGAASPAVAAYTAGQVFVFAAAGANTGSVTLNVNAAGAVALKKGSGATDLAAGDIPSGSLVAVVYLTSPGNHFRILAQSNPPAASTTTAGAIEAATAAEYRANTAGVRALGPNEVWSAMAEVALSDGATVSWDLSAGFDFVLTLGGNRTLAAPTNAKVGQKGRLRVIQDATGGRTLTWHANFDFAGGTAPTLSTAGGAKDVLYYDVIGATSILITVGARAYA
jgi:hypothetical protein